MATLKAIGDWLLDHCAPEGVHELQSRGLELANGEEVMELSKAH